MKYIVITSKHHDGFALFDSKVSAFDVVDATPWKRDVLKELADACRKRGIRLGVVSDAPRLQVWLRLCALGLQHVFDAVVTFDDTNERKPAAAPFREVLRRLGVQRSPHARARIVMVRQAPC